MFSIVKSVFRTLASVLIVSLMLVNCKPKAASNEEVQAEVASDFIINVVSEGMDIQMPDTITSGWHTFRFINKSPDVHFLLFDK